MIRFGALFLVLHGTALGQVPPPMVTQPPPWIPYYAEAGPSPTHIRLLDEFGRRKQKVGGILVGVGSAIALAGTGLSIAGAWDGSHSLGWAGVTTSLIGIGALVPGIVMLVSGSRDVADARRLRRQLWSPRGFVP